MVEAVNSKSLHQVKVMLRKKKESEIYRIKRAIIAHEGTMVEDHKTLKQLCGNSGLGTDVWYKTKTRYKIYHRIVRGLYERLKSDPST